MAKHQDLIVFQKADELAFKIYKITVPFPKTEMFGLTSQLRRAAGKVKNLHRPPKLFFSGAWMI